MDEASVLIWILVVFVAVLLLALLVMVARLSDLKRELKSLNGTLDKLESRVADQEHRLAQVQMALDSRGSDVFGPVIEAVKAFKSKGLVPALTLIGSYLFKSYLGKRRQKPLPTEVRSEGTIDES